MARRILLLPVIAASAFAAAPAGAEPRAMRVEYRAHPGCPKVEVLIEEITWRTPVAQVAAPGEDALAIRAHIDRRGKTSRAEIVIGKGRERITRTISGESCDEVVGALGLVTALAIDPHASTARKRPPPAPPPPPPLPRDPRLPEGLPPVAAPEIAGDPLPVEPEYASVAPGGPPRWNLGARASMALGVAPRPLLGGAVVAERLIDPRWGASLRLAIEVAATGSFVSTPGGASFLRVMTRVEGCALTVRVVPWLWFAPCVSAEGGLLRAEGVRVGSLKSVEQATVPWFGLGLLPRVVFERGAFFLEAQGGPVFPLVRRAFVFEFPDRADVTVHDVPPVTGAVSLGAGYVFP